MAKNNNQINEAYRQAISQSIKTCLLENIEKEVQRVTIMEHVIADEAVLAILKQKQEIAGKPVSDEKLSEKDRRKILFKKCDYIVDVLLKKMQDEEVLITYKGEKKRYTYIKKRPVLTVLNNGPVELLEIAGKEPETIRKSIEVYGREEDKNFKVINLNDKYLLCTIKNIKEEQHARPQYLKSIVNEAVNKCNSYESSNVKQK